MKLKNIFAITTTLLAISSSVFFQSYGFGKNKVQYENLEWYYNVTPHFNSYYHTGQGDLPSITVHWMEKAYDQLQKDFGFKHKKTIPLIVCGSPILFEQTNVTPGIIPEGVGGFTESMKNRIVIPFSGSYAEYRHVLHHELVHAFQFGILFDQFGSSLLRGSIQLPLWFAEGTAEYLSSGWDNDADMFMMDRTIFSSVPLPGPQMGGYMVYKGGQSFFYFLASSRGDSAFYEFLHSFRESKRVVESMEKIYKEDLLELGEEWHRELKRIYWPEIGKRENLDRKGIPVTSRKKSHSYFNLKPRISPDGKLIAYYSDAKDYTKIFISDKKGKVKCRIGQYGSGGFFDSFQPFRSGMCWSPRSDQLAFISKEKGKNAIRIYDVKNKKHIKTLIPEVSSISSPDWSPDGKHIVFTGLKKHCSDLYMINIENEKLEKLTNDIFHESAPRFSKDGNSIIFTSRDTSGNADRSDVLSKPTSDLHILTLSNKSVAQLTNTPWNEKDACYSPDGKNIAYISDRNGINNIYLAPVSHIDSAKALTDIIGGCLNPDWSTKDSSIVFTLFQNQGWDVWLIKNPTKKLHDSLPSETLWKKSLKDTSIHFFKRVTIPEDSTILKETKDISVIDTTINHKKNKETYTDDNTGIVDEGESNNNVLETNTDTSEIINRDTTALTDSGLSTIETDSLSDISEDLTIQNYDTTITNKKTISDSTTNKTSIAKDAKTSVKKDSVIDTQILPIHLKKHPYKLKLSIDIVSLGMAYSSLYGPAGQGMIVFSDLLGNHQFAVAGNIQGSFKENNIFLSYFNSKYRIDFGLGGFYNQYYTYASLDFNRLFHDTDKGAMFILRYPFSIFSRIDFNFFYKNMERVPQKHVSGKIKDDPDSSKQNLNITLTTLSYSFDNILWGITGPVNGLRANAALLIAPPFKKEDASFLAIDIDVRHYWHINRKFVWANRITAGFSEPMGRDESARRYFLGGNQYWMFYRINRKNYDANLHNTFYSSYIVPFRGWNYFDITGTRYAVLNTEFRFPFIKSINVVWPLPMSIRYINGAFFIDMGNAWDPEDQQKNIPLPQKILGGIGFGLRANLGIFILRYDLAWKTDWHTYMENPQNYFSMGAEF